MTNNPYGRNESNSYGTRLIIILALVASIFIYCGVCRAGEVWKITSYCACEKCCGKSDGITASGKKVEYGFVALNWLPFGTKVNIKGLGEFVVMDRGAKSLFGSKKNHIKHLDVYMPTHSKALKFGVKWLEVEVIKGMKKGGSRED